MSVKLSCRNCYFYRVYRMAGGSIMDYIIPPKVVVYCQINHDLQDEGVCKDYKSKELKNDG